MAIVQSEAEEIVTQLLTAPPDDPYPLYARLRTIAPIHRASVGDFWTLSRYEDLRLALKDKRFVRDYDDFRRRNSLGPVDYERPFIRLQRKWFVFSNPPAYGRKRALYNTAFKRTPCSTAPSSTASARASRRTPVSCWTLRRSAGSSRSSMTSATG